MCPSQFGGDILARVGAMTEKDLEKQEPWLILAHCFNLDGRAASHTITDRIPLLMKQGIKPVVISAPHGDKDCRFPHYRVPSPAPSGILFELRYIINKRVPGKTLQDLLKGLLLLFCLPFLIVEKILIHLDSHWSWVITGTLSGAILIRKHKPSVIYSTAGPSSTHWVGYLLHRFTKLPWIAELHDPLVYEGNRRKGQRYWFDWWLEKMVFREASAVIYFSEMALERAQQRNGISGKGFVLRPGAEPPDFSDAHYEKRKRMHFGHFGSLAEGRNLSAFMEGLHAALVERPSWRDVIRLDVYGCELDPISRQRMSEFSLNEIVIPHGRLEFDPVSEKSGRQRVLEAMRQSDVLLLIHGEGQVCHEYVPSKLYEYLLTARPILGFVSKNTELGQMLNQTGHTVVEAHDKIGIKNALSDFVLKWEIHGLPDREQISPFTVAATVNKLIEIAKGLA